MRFGVREIANVVFRAKATQKLGSRTFYKNEPVLYFDTLKTSSLEGAATTVYAQGGRGNPRLVAWEGERTLTLTMEDALISPESFAILSGADLFNASAGEPMYVHTTSRIKVEEDNTIVLPEEAAWDGYKDKNNDPYYKENAGIFIITLDENGQSDAEPCVPAHEGVASDHKTITCYGHDGKIEKDSIVLVDYYIKRTSGTQMIEITADKFGGSYYVEASTLFRDEATGMDMPAEFVIPNCKVQSNFTFSMAATGDPSTFTFTLDAFPDYTKFDQTHKVMCAIQVITDAVDSAEETREPCLDMESRVVGRALTETAGYGTIKMSDLCEKGAEIIWDGNKCVLTGNFKPVTKWTELPAEPRPSEDKPMYFYTVDLDKSYQGKPFQAFKDGVATGESKNAGAEELFWVLNLSDYKNYRFESNGEVICEIDLTQVNKIPYEKKTV